MASYDHILPRGGAGDLEAQLRQTQVQLQPEHAGLWEQLFPTMEQSALGSKTSFQVQVALGTKAN